MSTTFIDRASLIRAVTDKIAQLPEAQRRVGLFLLGHYARIPFMTTTELAKAAGTSQSSVTRFVMGLGFENYADFARSLGSIVLNEIHETIPAERFARAGGVPELTDILDAEVRHLQGLYPILRSDSFAECVQRVDEARHVIVAGFGAASSIAQHVNLYLSRIKPGITCVTDTGAPTLTQLVHLGFGDCAVLFAVPRDTAEALTFITVLAERGVHVLLVTDRTGTVLAPRASDIMVVPVTNGPTTAVPAAMLALGSLLVDAVALRAPQRTLDHLRTFEALASGSHFFAQDSRQAQPSWEAQMESFTADRNEDEDASMTARKTPRPAQSSPGK